MIVFAIVFGVVFLIAVAAAWDIADKRLRAAASGHVQLRDALSRVEVLTAQLRTAEERCEDLREAVSSLDRRATLLEKQQQETKNRFEAAVAAAKQHRRGWDAARPVKIG